MVAYGGMYGLGQWNHYENVFWVPFNFWWSSLFYIDTDLLQWFFILFMSSRSRDRYERRESRDYGRERDRRYYSRSRSRSPGYGGGRYKRSR